MSDLVQTDLGMPSGHQNALTEHAMLKEVGRIGGYATGHYHTVCLRCDRQFIGDKRAFHCLPCAVKDLKSCASAPTSSEELLQRMKKAAQRKQIAPSGHLDFEAKAREIIRAELDDNSDEAVWDGENATLCQAIASALSEAYEAGRNAERSRVKAAVVCEAFWRHRGVTPDENTQSPDAIVAQDLTYDRRLLEYLCDELAEPIEPLADIQINAVRRQLAAIRKRGSQVTAPKSQGEFETKSIIDHPYYNPRTSDDER